MNDRLALEDVERLLLGGVRMQWGDFAPPCDLLDEQICPVRLRPGRLKGQQVVVEPERLALVVIEHDRPASLRVHLRCHGVLLLAAVYGETNIS
jgi:hypothetical protein